MTPASWQIRQVPRVRPCAGLESYIDPMSGLGEGRLWGVRGGQTFAIWPSPETDSLHVRGWDYTDSIAGEEFMARRREEWQGRNKGSAYIRWYSGDILSDGFVASLMPAEENCYRRLLDFNARDGFIPDDTARLAMMCKVSIAEFEPIWEAIGEKFPAVNSDAKKRSNTRIKFELLYQKSRRDSAFERGKKGGRPVNCNKVKGLRDNLQVSSRLPLAKAKAKLNKPIQIQTQIQDPDPINKEKKKSRRGAPTAPPPSPAVYWNPVPVWKKNDASHKSAVLRVDGEHLTQLIDDYPSVNVPGEIVNLKHHALNNPGWAKAKRDWRKTLGNWLKREARGNQSQSAAAAEVAWEQEQGQAPDNAAAIAACEKELGPHAGRLTNRERYSFCAEGCGYRETRHG